MVRKSLALIAAAALASPSVALPQPAPSPAYEAAPACNGIIAILIGLVVPGPRRC